MPPKNNKIRFNCQHCQWQGERGRNLKKCPQCGKSVTKSAHRSGRAAKRRNRAKHETHKQLQTTHGDIWGLGGQHQEKQNNRLIRQSLRWKTNATPADIETTDPRELKAKEIAVLVTRRNMLSTDASVSNNAVRNLVSMEGQNQKDDLGREPQQHQHPHLHEDNPYMNAPMDVILEAKLALAKLEEAGE